jgi:hypothetical protein
MKLPAAESGQDRRASFRLIDCQASGHLNQHGTVPSGPPQFSTQLIESEAPIMVGGLLGICARSPSKRPEQGGDNQREVDAQHSALALPAQPLDAAALATRLLPSALERVVPAPLAVLDELNETRAAREDETPDPPAKRAAHFVRGESLAAAPEPGHPPVRLLAEHDADETWGLTRADRGAGLRACAGGTRWHGRRRWGRRR